jgi:hypothetical protein
MRNLAPTTLVLIVLVAPAPAFGGQQPYSDVVAGPSTPTQNTAAGTVDAYIDPRMSPEDRQAMRGAMAGLAPWQMQNVIFVDFAKDGRIYANNPEALAQAVRYVEVPEKPGVLRAPSGEEFAEPAEPAFPNPSSGSAQQGVEDQMMTCPSPPPTSDGTGAFYRTYVPCTTWMINTIWPWPYPMTSRPDPGHECDTFVFKNKDAGLATIGGFSSTGAEFEMNLQIKHTDQNHGFQAWVAYKGQQGKGVRVGWNKSWGCFSNGTLVFTVQSRTQLAGTFTGQMDKRLYPGAQVPPTETVTITVSVPKGDGWRLDGNGEITFLSVQIAQEPQKLDSGSHISMVIGNTGQNWFSAAGTGTYAKPTTGCSLVNPAWYDGGPSGLCTDWLQIQVGAHPYPWKSPYKIFVSRWALAYEDVDVCLGNPSCNYVPIFQ